MLHVTLLNMHSCEGYQKFDPPDFFLFLIGLNIISWIFRGKIWKSIRIFQRHFYKHILKDFKTFNEEAKLYIIDNVSGLKTSRAFLSWSKLYT